MYFVYIVYDYDTFGIIKLHREMPELRLWLRKRIDWLMLCFHWDRWLCHLEITTMLRRQTSTQSMDTPSFVSLYAQCKIYCIIKFCSMIVDMVFWKWIWKQNVHHWICFIRHVTPSIHSTKHCLGSVETLASTMKRQGFAGKLLHQHTKVESLIH